MNKPIQIRNEQVSSDIRELASIKRKPITDAVGEAVRHELERERQEKQARRREVDRLLADIRALPVVGPMPTDDDFYDQDGFPK